MSEAVARKKSAGYAWYQWAVEHLPAGTRGIGTRQLYILYRMVSEDSGAYTPWTQGDRDLCDSLLDRRLVRKGGVGRYVITPQGRKVFEQLRGLEYYQQRGL